MDGVIIINKPKQYTSHDIVNIVAKEEVKKLNLINMCARTIENWFTLCR